MEGVEDEVGNKLTWQSNLHRIPIVTMIRCHPNSAIRCARGDQVFIEGRSRDYSNTSVLQTRFFIVG